MDNRRFFRTGKPIISEGQQRYEQAVALGMPAKLGAEDIGTWRAAEIWLAGHAAGSAPAKAAVPTITEDEIACSLSGYQLYIDSLTPEQHDRLPAPNGVAAWTPFDDDGPEPEGELGQYVDAVKGNLPAMEA